MPRKHLTTKALQALKPTPDKQVDYFDETLPCFFVRVSPSGTKSFGVMYRHGRRLRRMSLGRYPPLTLAGARDEAKNAFRLSAKGQDPAAKKKLDRQDESFAELANLYLERYAKLKKKSWREDYRKINANLVPALGNIRAKNVTRADVRFLLSQIAARAPVEANRTLSIIKKIYTWAISEDLLAANPCLHIPAPGGRGIQKDRVLSEDEIKRVWKACNEEESLMAATFKLRLVTAQRASEVFSMEWSEIDLDNGCWTIPAHKAKNGLAHRVPLNRVAVRILERLNKQSTDPTRWVFPGPQREKHMNPRTAQKSIPRIRKRAGVPTAHSSQPHDVDGCTPIDGCQNFKPCRIWGYSRLRQTFIRQRETPSLRFMESSLANDCVWPLEAPSFCRFKKSVAISETVCETTLTRLG